MNVAFWPTFTWPTSASSTSTCSSILARSSASVNSTGAWNDAATVWPGSTFARQHHAVDRASGCWPCRGWSRPTAALARAWVTFGARAGLVGLGALRLGLGGVHLALDGTLPPDSCRDLRKRASVGARLGHRRLRLQHLRLGRGQAGPRLRHRVLELGEIEPGQHLPLLHAIVVVDQHRSTMPDSSLPTSTWLVGCRLPVADTLTTRLPMWAGSVL